MSVGNGVRLWKKVAIEGVGGERRGAVEGNARIVVGSDDKGCVALGGCDGSKSVTAEGKQRIEVGSEIELAKQR